MSEVCWKCIEDVYLRERVKREGERLKCSVCRKTRKAFSVERLGEELAPILRQHIKLGREILTSDDNDHTYYEQQGDPLSHFVQEVLGQYFDFNEEIVDAVVSAEHVDVAGGGIPFFDSAADYESTPISLHAYYDEWNFVLQELKHSRRFFNSAAQSLFGRLFHGVETMKSFSSGAQPNESVVWALPEGSKLYRARRCDSFPQLNEFHAQPFEKCGPPPPNRARAGRMNVEGVAVFYGATDRETCLAEMRPAIGGDTAVIELQTTKSLRMLDFTRLQKSYGQGLSYFQSNFTEEAERLAFLRRLHTLISQPVVPGREEDYLITQTLAEYLAHVHQEPFDGLLFKSVQRDGGTNVVLFAYRDEETPGKRTFPLTYVDGSLKLFATKKIEYEHTQRHFMEDEGKLAPDYDWDEDPYLDYGWVE
jgi:hypothetical protein